MKTFAAISVLALAPLAFGQMQDQSAVDRPEQKTKQKKNKKQTNAAQDIGGGVAKGAGNAAAGVGKGAADLATLHPIDAGAAVGTGAVKAGKNVTVGSAKGAGKIGKGVGHLFKKVL